jgi:hypothetical protein
MKIANCKLQIVNCKRQRVFYFALCLFMACAKMAPPSGGPPDTTPPSIVSSSPADGTTNVPLTAPIRVRFTEPMNRLSVESVLFIVPAPPIPLTFQWHDKELKIITPDSLQPMRTYTITVGSGAQDIHGNRMTTSYTSAFSTGPRIDKGSITGYVNIPDRPAVGTSVWLYDLNRHPTPDPAHDRPDYRTQTGSHGEYRLSALAWSSYRLFAIHDRDRDSRYTPETDPIAIPSYDVSLNETTDQATMNDLTLVPPDTTTRNTTTTANHDTTVTDERFLGTISGTIYIQDSGSQEKVDSRGANLLCYLRAVNTDDKSGRPHLASQPPGRYEWKLPSGHYRLSAFLDENHNGVHDEGRPFPFTPSEPFRSLPDTVLVRPHWETRGIDFLFYR